MPLFKYRCLDCQEDFEEFVQTRPMSSIVETFKEAHSTSPMKRIVLTPDF